MEHLDAATLEEFYDFFKKFYVPNNAILVVAGDIEYSQTKQLIEKYFSPVKRGADVPKVSVQEEPISQEIKASFEDPNIQLPMYVTAYRFPSVKHNDTYALDLLIAYLTGGKSAPMYKKIVDEKKTAMELMAFTHPYLVEDYRMSLIAAIPTPGTTREQIQEDIDAEIKKVQTDLISERDFQKLQNTIENAYVNQNSNLETLAENLATNYMLYKDTNMINTEIEKYRSVTREQIREAAQKYLQSNSRLILDYVPAAE
ncbi:MAG TPA: insulinase family protein, partial [Flavobacterium sp.]|nr:insulinase family protein [Flavobacterium sp.]